MIEAVESGALVVVVAADEREEEEERSVVAIAWIAALDTSMSSTPHGSWATPFVGRAMKHTKRRAKERGVTITVLGCRQPSNPSHPNKGGCDSIRSYHIVRRFRNVGHTFNVALTRL
jgi:hypothetical protein